MTLFCIVLVLIQLYYWYFFYGLLAKEPLKSASVSPDHSVSILICIKNEVANLHKNLPSIMSQTYRNYSVLVADDFSSDNPTEFLNEIDSEKRIIKSFKVTENMPGKKAAMSEAIALSEGQLLLLTDADCAPHSEEWVTSMVSAAQEPGKQLVLGYSPYKKADSIVSRWAHFEAWLTAIQYLSYAKKGMPYMGVGRNLLYHRNLVSPEVFKKYSHLASGDDDLTVMQVATATNTAINLDPNSFVATAAPTSFRDYWNQKTRHFSTATSYQGKSKFLLSLYSFSQILFFVILTYLLFSRELYLALFIYALRMLLLLPVVARLKKKLAGEFSLLCFPIYDLCQVLFYMIFSFAVLFPQKSKW